MTARRRLWHWLRRLWPAPGAAADPPAGAESALPGRRASGLQGRPVRISLALQGGGSHGAFTWGVLDRLLDDASIDIAAVSGTSAGALNAAVLATGLARGGRDGARAALAAFWHDVGREGAPFARFTPSGLEPGGPAAAEFEQLPTVRWAQSFLRTLSPTEFNPLQLNPLRALVGRHVDAEVLRSGALPLFITATHVRSGQARVFTGAALSLDALMASACLPMLFHPVAIDGEAYWDGGYTGNPSIHPLIARGGALDLLVVRINPLWRDGTPTRGAEIAERIGEIGFNASFLAEMRALALLARSARAGDVDLGRWRDLRLHMVADDAGLAAFGAASKLNADPRFLDTLCALGREAADAWLARHRGDLGVRSSFDVEQTFLAAAPAPV